MRVVKHIILSSIAILILLSKAFSTEIYVGIHSEKLDRDGSMSSPYANLEDALRQVREWRRLGDPKIKSAVYILVKDGVYRPSQPILIRPEDSGTLQSPTSIRGLGDKAVFSGGITVKGWRRVGKNNLFGEKHFKNIYVADAPKVGGRYFPFRQMWVGDTKAIRAESHSDYELPRILNWNFKEQTATIPNVFKNIEFKDGMEFFIHQWWAIAQLRIKEAIVKKDSIVLSFHDPESKIQSEHPWPSPWLSKETGNSAFRLVNSIQFLDTPGEWFLDEQDHKIYYYKRDKEDLETSEIVVPYLETILELRGTLENPVSHIHIEGLNFKHSSWIRPHYFGHVALQAGMYFIDAYKLETPGTPDKKGLENQAWVGRPKSAIVLSHTKQNEISNCKFTHLASTAVDFEEANYKDSFTGNLIKDVGGNGVLVGKFSDEQFEAHLPYHPKDERIVSDGVSIENNLIHNVCNEDWGAVGIGVGFARNINILNNDISDLAYTGISVGWGWTPTINISKNNIVKENRITRYGKFMYDVAGIYTLSAQPGTIIQNNLIDSIYLSPYAHIPDHWFYLYTDEGSAYMNISDNWYPENKILKNANGPSVEWKENGPQVDLAKVANAGLSSTYRSLLKYQNKVEDRSKFNKHIPFDKPVYVQISDPDGSISAKSLESFIQRQGAEIKQIYRWKGYTLLKTTDDIAQKISSAWKADFPAVKCKVFKEIFYSFESKQHCPTNSESDEEDFVILTAQLVDDPNKRDQYYQYHKDQFEQWPEISKGFCNAGFNDVTMYRNDHQLLLYISYPKGKSFDEINALTTKDNPKVEEWNKLMSTFQRGIQGTAANESWIFYKK
ncbi:L-rhamnose mutarotase [Sphingobacterium bovistauri]|uniref:Right-handed parallel beta-helix repeat-containing protein n=1 Tax=Sphingobacterium bovistauri TaxID=2781959 RepID=A0ABS7Z598_9SPHI|nr:L-rhamnose mutarotase [Sphingobacterium bovistauri]MCA5004722.1 right-handed parallel beta-helix repeat-containing protein [Sphingobacterium bovistauri]